MDDQGGNRGRHAADAGGPNDPESGEGRESGAHRAARSTRGGATDPVGAASPEPGPAGADDEPTGPGAALGAEPTRPGPTVGAEATGSASAGRGRVRRQDPTTTTPRPPSVAEQRARREAQRRERAQAEAAQAAAERKRTVRKRVLVGGGVAVGLVAVVAIVYAAAQPDEVEAVCTDPNGVVVDDDECNRPATSGYYNSSGVFVPIFIGTGGRPYQYHYGSRAPRGTVVTGGTTSPPSSGTAVRSGTSGTRIGSTDSSGSVSRGGLGVGGSSSSSGSSGSSSSGS